MNSLLLINKGNYSLDTPQREAEFERRRGVGWETEYAAYRRAWNERPVQGEYGEWPLLVDLEVSSACNLQCPMCYTITDDFKRRVARKFMPFSLFCRLVNEMASHVPALRLSFRGESTLHPKFLDCVRYAKAKGVREVSFLTNAGHVDEAMMRGLVEAGVDWITVSVDGLGEVYENIRKPLRFQDTLNKIKRLRELRVEMGRLRPVVKVQSIWPAIADNPGRFLETFSPIADLVAFNPLIDYLEHDSLDSIVYDEPFTCQMLYQRLVIASDGAILPCSNDEKSLLALGNIEGQTIHSVWNGSALKAFRDLHATDGGFRNSPPCLHCYLPRATTADTCVLPDGRTLVVRNYVNRSQSIGE